MKANLKLRNTAREKNVNLWEVAEKFNVADTTFARWLRHEFEPDRERQALQFIDEIAKERNIGNSAGVQ